jgi:glycosyltransferase involved in cell wall biosynthesis
MTKFSIIIPCRAVNDYLIENISHLLSLNRPDFEVLLVLDEASSYKLPDKRFRVVPSGIVGPAEKRNLAAASAKGEILVFLDDDAYPAEDWLAQAEDVFEDATVYALGGPAITPPESGLLEKIAGKILESPLGSGNTFYRHRASTQKLISDYQTVNFFVRKNVFDLIGGFPTDFWPGEDTKLCLNLVVSMGRKFPYDTQVLVYHHRRKLFRPFLKQISRYGRQRGYFAKIFPETSRLPQYFVPSVFVLFLLGGFIWALFCSLCLYGYIVVLVFYTSLVLLESIRVSMQENNPRVAPLFVVGMFLTHITYGTNFIMGLLFKPKLKLKRYNFETGNYLEG